jgi:hypothetical protein
MSWSRRKFIDAIFSYEYGHPCFEIISLYIADKPPLEAGNESAVKLGDLRFRPIAAQSELFLRLKELVKSVEKFLFNTLLAG